MNSKELEEKLCGDVGQPRHGKEGKAQT